MDDSSVDSSPSAVVASAVDPTRCDWMNQVFTWPDGTTETHYQLEKRLKDIGLRDYWVSKVEELWFSEGVKHGGSLTWADCQVRCYADFPPGCEVDYVCDKDDLSESDRAFLRVANRGLRRMRLKNRSAIDEETAWVAANLRLPYPSLRTVPSKAALCQVIDARLNPRVSEKFWSTYWGKRLSPGDTSSRSKKKAFKEDEVDAAEVAGRSHDESLEGRLFGGGG